MADHRGGRSLQDLQGPGARAGTARLATQPGAPRDARGRGRRRRCRSRSSRARSSASSGPNGAGKTTTLKMLSGLLHPTSGRCRVLGFEPKGRPSALLRQITLVMGNRNQLQWDLPALDSFELNRAIYRIPRTEFTALRDELIELLEIGDLVSKPVRNLSLGERMKMEIAGALLHRPKVLFLDEPTIGLDITMQRRIRKFVAEYNARYGATVILTSHYMADVQALCKRVIVIHHGRLVFDGDLSTLSDRFTTQRTITARLAEGDDITILTRPRRHRGGHVAAAGRARRGRPDDRGPADRRRDRAVLRRRRRSAVITMYAAHMRQAVLQQFQYRGGQLLLHDRDDRRAGGVPRGLVDDRPGPRWFDRRPHTRCVRRVLHRVDVGAQHEHRAHPVRVGGADQGGHLRRAVAEARAPDPRGPRLVRRLEARRARPVDPDRPGPRADLPTDAESHDACSAACSSSRSGERS